MLARPCARARVHAPKPTRTPSPPPHTHARSVFARNWGGDVEFVTEDYIRLDDEGNLNVTRQCLKHIASGRTGSQYVVGFYAGDKPPPGH